MPEVARACLAALGNQLLSIKEQIVEFDRMIMVWHRSNETHKSLHYIPGVGPMLATAMVASVADPRTFRSGRNFSAWIGLVPKQHSSGGKDRLVAARLTVRGAVGGNVSQWESLSIRSATRVGFSHSSKHSDHRIASEFAAMSARISHKRVNELQRRRLLRRTSTHNPMYDAFPSGHAMHVGAVASAVSWAYPKSAPVAWAIGGVIAATRIVILAHWTTDVLAGLAIGALVERCVRPRSERPMSEEGAPQASPSPRSTVSGERASFRKILPSSL